MIDTHIHIDEEAFDADREEMIARQKQSGVEAMLIPGVNAASIPAILDICHAHPGYCYPALGFHPQDVKADWQQQWAIIEAAIRTHRPELVAIGEIGLDYYWDTTFKAEQQEIFRRQLALAQELDLPVMIHNRDATEDTLKILKEFPHRGVVHCFNGSKEVATEILKMNYYLGIGGVLTFKNCKLSEILSQLNNNYQSSINRTSSIVQSSIINRLLLETDAPYLAPTPHRGERNESSYMRYVAERLAQVFDRPVEEIISITSANAKTLFRLK